MSPSTPHTGKWRPGMKPRLPFPKEATPLAVLIGVIGSLIVFQSYRLIRSNHWDVKTWGKKGAEVWERYDPPTGPDTDAAQIQPAEHK